MLLNGEGLSKEVAINKYYTAPIEIKVPSNSGTYTYLLSYNGKEVCRSTLKVIELCSVDKTTIGLGESFKFTANYPGSCYNTTFSGPGVSHNNCQMSYEITPTAIGTHTYTFNVTGGSLGTAECTQTVIVEEVPPTITCPADLTGIALNSKVSVTPQSLTGCTNGCNYTIYETSATGSGYTGGEVSFTGESAAGEKTYTWNVSNSKGSDECEFKVTYEEGGSVVNPCECSSYCNDCSAIKTNSGTYNSSDYNCIFFTSASKLNIGGSATKINGVAVTNTNSCYDATTCENNLNALGITKVNGGYYMSLPSWNYTDISISGSIPTECAGGGSGGGGSGTDPDPDPGTGDSGDVTIIETFTNATYSAGKYTIKTCSGNVGQKTIQTDSGSSTDCNTWIEGSPSWSAGPWNTCNGQILVTFPMTFTVPEGGSIKMSGNCW